MFIIIRLSKKQKLNFIGERIKNSSNSKKLIRTENMLTNITRMFCVWWDSRSFDLERNWQVMFRILIVDISSQIEVSNFVRLLESFFLESKMCKGRDINWLIHFIFCYMDYNTKTASTKFSKQKHVVFHQSCSNPSSIWSR